MFEYKQVLVVREDLEMSRGKLSVQVAHASVSAAENARKGKPEWFEKWREEGQKKVVVGVSSESELEDLEKKADNLGVPNKLITDAGLTELSPETITVLGVGPGPVGEVDRITGDLKLLSG